MAENVIMRIAPNLITLEIDPGYTINGVGNMSTTIYDTDGDGKVDASEVADRALLVDWANVQNKPTTYSVGVHTHLAVDVIESTSKRFVSDGEKVVWNAKGTSNLALGESDLTAYRGDRGTIAYNHSQITHAPYNANYYVHPGTHPATIIVQTADYRFVSDTEKTAWNLKASTSLVTSIANGLMSFNDKVKIDTVASGANNYVHPAAHDATMITESPTKRFVTDSQITNWNAGAGSGLQLGETSTTAYRGDRGLLTYNHISDIVAHITGAERTAWNAKQDVSAKGAVNGYAGLDGTGKVPTTQLPTLIALGETISTAYRGDRGKTAYDHSQALHASVEISAIAPTSPISTNLWWNSTSGNLKIYNGGTSSWVDVMAGVEAIIGAGTIGMSMFDIDVLAEFGDKAEFKTGTRTFTTGTALQVIDSFITTLTFVTVIPTSAKAGNWTVESANGSFTVTSDTPETNVTFEWNAIKGGM